MSDYVAQRLAQFGAQPKVKRKVSKAVQEDPINLRHPVHIRAHQYIKQKRKSGFKQATWFDVHDAFIAGWNAAKGAKR